MIDNMIDDKKVINLMISGSWQELLFELVHDMDPWDIDLKILSLRFIEYIESFKGSNGKDLKVSVKVLLVAVIIYKMKVDNLTGNGSIIDTKDTDEEETDFFNVNDENIVTSEDVKGISIPPISIMLRRMPRGKLSLDDLVCAHEKEMKVTVRRIDSDDYALELAGEDLTQHIENLYTVI